MLNLYVQKSNKKRKVKVLDHPRHKDDHHVVKTPRHKDVLAIKAVIMIICHHAQTKEKEPKLILQYATAALPYSILPPRSHKCRIIVAANEEGVHRAMAHKGRLRYLRRDLLVSAVAVAVANC